VCVLELLLGRSDVDLDKGVLRFRHMKVGGELLYPMGEHLTGMLRKRMADDEPLRKDWLWPSPTSASGRTVEAKEKRSKGLPSPHEYRHLIRAVKPGTFALVRSCLASHASHRTSASSSGR
jgi:integrase